MATISENLDLLESTKTDIRNAITFKGGKITGSFATYADVIRSLELPEGKWNIAAFGITLQDCKWSGTAANNAVKKIDFTDCGKVDYFFRNFKNSSPQAIVDLRNVNLYEGVAMFKNCYIETLQLAKFIQIKDCEDFFYNSTVPIMYSNSSPTEIELIGKTAENLIYNNNGLLNIKNITINCSDLVLPILSGMQESIPIKVKNKPQIQIYGKNNTFTVLRSIDFTEYTGNTVVLFSEEVSTCTSVEGVPGLKTDCDFSKLPNIDNQSVENILNTAANMTGSNSITFKFYTDVYVSLSESLKELAASKNIILAR